MSRLSDSVAQSGAGAGAYTRTTMANPLVGGYFGFSANMANYVANAGFRLQQLQCAVLWVPGAIQNLDNPELWVGHIKAVMEQHTRTIEGFQRALQVDHFTQPAGGAGAEQFDPGNVTQQQPTPSHGIGEKYGFPNGTLFEWWIRLFIMDPDIKRPLIMFYPNPPADLLPDMTSMICLYWDTDPTGFEIINAYLGVGMQPKSSGTRESRMDRSQAVASDLVHNIEFTGTFIMNEAVNQLAAEINAQRMTVGAIPYMQELPDELTTINTDVQAVKTGVANQVEDLVNSQVNLT